MLSLRRGRSSPLALVAVLLLPPFAAVAGGPSAATAGPSYDGSCLAPGAPDLAVDADRACRAVAALVPSWRGSVQVVLVDGEEGVAAEVLDGIIRVHPAAWEGLTAPGRQAVLTHELVHVATAGLTTDRTPPWLVEGLAEAVAWREVRALPDAVVAQELASLVRAHQVPRGLPTAQDFASHPAPAYQRSWLAVDLLLRRYGTAAVLELYRAAGTRGLHRALSAVGLTRQALQDALHAELVRRLT
ncbi:MAG TPA: hypothetical protein VMZ11_03170 [Mycobacteriales bacterium]|nr:hypothetical protein [Mycobacteriales bacterium]